jgi:hypothetical protein
MSEARVVMSVQGLFQRLVLALFLAAGFAVVWGLLGAYGVLTSNDVVGAPQDSEYLLFLAPEVQPVICHSTGDGGADLLDLEGKPLRRLPSRVRAQGTSTTALAELPAGKVRADNSDWKKRVRSFADGGAPAVFWYFVGDGRPDGSAYFVGYDSRTRSRVGYLGTAGFRETALPAGELIPLAGNVSGGLPVLCTQPARDGTGHPDPGAVGQAPRGSLSSWDVYVLARGGTIYHVDLHHRSVEVVLNEPPLRSAALVGGVADPVRGMAFHLAVRTNEAVLVLDERGGLLKRYPIPPAFREVPFAFAQTPTGEALLHWHAPFDSLVTHIEHRFCWVSPAGQTHEAKTTLAYHNAARDLTSLGGLVAPSPFVLGAFLIALRPAELLDNGLESSFSSAAARAFWEFWPALVIAQVLALGLALLCYRRQVRFGAGRAEQVVWPLFVVVLGLPGWIGYRFGRTWPVLESCSACGIQTPRDRGGCAWCEEEFPGPVHSGIEVFA